MTRSFLIALLLIFQGTGDRTLITRSGERLRGRISRLGDSFQVETSLGSRTIPASEVGCVFGDVSEVVLQADERFGEAKKLYEQAGKLDAANPARNEKLLTAIDLAQGASTLRRLLEPFYPEGDHGRHLQIIQQFLRLCRSTATSERAGASPAGTRIRAVSLAEASFAFEPPAEEEASWLVKDDLGPGLGSCVQDLSNPDPARRLEAVNRLTHPPALSRFPALFRLLESERDPAVVKAIVAAAEYQEGGSVLKSLGWVRREADPAKRTFAFALARSAGDREGFDFLIDWFAESPPTDHPERAAFAAAFRQYRAFAVPQLKELLTRHRQPKLQIEILRQMGVIGDKAFGPMLVKALPAYPRDAVASLLKIGKPGLPTLVEGARSNDPDTRRICNALCRKVTGLARINLDAFEKWWSENRKSVLEEEKAWWDDQARTGFPVRDLDFATYDVPLESLLY